MSYPVFMSIQRGTLKDEDIADVAAKTFSLARNVQGALVVVKGFEKVAHPEKDREFFDVTLGVGNKSWKVRVDVGP